MGNPQVQNIAKGLAQSTNEVVQKACLFAKRNCSSETPDFVYIGSSVALAALISTTPFLTKRKQGKTADETMRNMVKTINKETMLLSALIAANMHEDLSDIKDHNDDDIGECVSAGMSCKFGPETMAHALRDWVKLTGKNPADYFDQGMLDALREAEAKIAAREQGAEKMVNEFFAPSSGTLQ